LRYFIVQVVSLDYCKYLSSLNYFPETDVTPSSHTQVTLHTLIILVYFDIVARKYQFIDDLACHSEERRTSSLGKSLMVFLNCLALNSFNSRKQRMFRQLENKDPQNQGNCDILLVGVIFCCFSY
jgi:hypothetical protein